MTKSTGNVPKTKTAGRSAAGFATAEPVPGAGFLARTKLKKAGGSLVMTVPASARNLLHLTEGQEMAISVEGSKVIMEPVAATQPVRVRRPKYTLDQLLAETASDPAMSDEERAWHDAPPMGNEVW